MNRIKILDKGPLFGEVKPWPFEATKLVEKQKKELIKVIKEITEAYWHVLDCYPATIEVNGPRALLQVAAVAKLDILYELIGEKRPRYKCDDTTKLNY